MSVPHIELAELEHVEGEVGSRLPGPDDVPLFDVPDDGSA